MMMMMMTIIIIIIIIILIIIIIILGCSFKVTVFNSNLIPQLLILSCECDAAIVAFGPKPQTGSSACLINVIRPKKEADIPDPHEGESNS